MTDDSSHSQRIDILADEFLARGRCGENPTIEEYCDKHPDLAEDIRDLFPTLEMMEVLKPDLDEAQPDRGVPDTLERIGDYRILGEIGRGGMGVVYEAEQETLGRRVALKVLCARYSWGDGGLERFQHEAQAAAKMHHTNIVPVFEIGQDSGYIFYAMQLIQGQGLDRVIKDLARLRLDSEAGKKAGRASVGPRVESVSSPDRQDPSGAQANVLARSLMADRFPAETMTEPSIRARRSGHPSDAGGSATQPGDIGILAVVPGGTDLTTTGSSSRRYYRSVARIGRQAAEALVYSHARGVIHRDIKPSNLLLDAAGVVWITDFGVAKSDDHDMTHTGEIVGTIRYMSPARFRGRSNVLSDIYALGLTLYELAVLRPAFDATDRLELIQMIKESEPAKPRSIDPCIPIDLETIILKAMDKEAASRYQSADDLAEDLRRFIKDEPIQARRVSMPGRLVRWARRNKKLAVSLSAVAGLTFILAIVSSTAALYYHRQEHKQTVLRTAAERNLYFAEMNVAGLALIERDGLGRVVELTERWQPANAGVDYRGWEWYCLQSQVEDDAFTFPEAGSPIRGAVWSPDGTLLASTFSGGFHIWDMARKQRSKTLRVHAGETFAIDWSPDGTRLASASADRTVKIWKVSTWEEAISLEGCREGDYWWHVVWSPSGSMIAASSYDPVTRTSKAMTWDATTGRRLNLLPGGGGSIDWAPDESKLAISGHDKIEVWNVQTAARIGVVGQQDPVITCARWSPDGARLASASDDGIVRIWDGQRVWAAHETAQPIHMLSGHTSNVIQANWSPDGRWLASASRDGTVSIWDADTGAAVRTLRGHSGDVLTVGWSPDGRQLASAGKDQTLKIWSFNAGATTGTFAGHAHQVRDVCWSPDGNQLASASWDETVKIWDRATGLVRHDLKHSMKVESVCWSPDGMWLATGTGNGTVTLWNVTTGSLEKTFQGSQGSVYYGISVQFCPDGQWLASGGVEEEIRIWNIESGRAMVIPGASASGLEVVRLGSDGPHVADGVDPILRVWDLVSSGGRSRELDGLTARVAPIGSSWSPDGRRFVTTSGDTPPRVWDASTARGTHILRGHSRSVTAADWSPDGERIATVGNDGKLKLWDSQTGSITLTLQGQARRLFGVRWSPDGKSIATVGDRPALTIWDASTAYERERP
ncbi:MAG: protein kinase [bacterium]|nr:protein kinase [bacterium]